ncbi:MAG TPA: PaaI family thioesterase [Tepidiformaceae bacterium]
MTSPEARRGFNDYPLHRALGITLEEVRPGFARIAMKTSGLTLGGIGGSVHGGLLATMVDIVMLEALSATRQPGDQFAGTAELSISYLRPALGDRVFAEATVIKKGRSLAVAEVSIIDEQGRLCARGRTTYALRAANPG